MPIISIIDDELQIAELLAELGELSGYETRCFTQAKHFLHGSSRNDWNQQDSDIIFLDLSMPDIDGIEVITELGNSQCKAAIFIISGFDTELLNSAKHIAMEYGLNVVETITKPMDVDLITRRLEELKNTF